MELTALASQCDVWNVRLVTSVQQPIHTPLSVFLDNTVLLAACLVLTVQQVWSVLQPHKNQQDNASQDHILMETTSFVLSAQ